MFKKGDLVIFKYPFRLSVSNTTSSLVGPIFILEKNKEYSGEVIEVRDDTYKIKLNNPPFSIELSTGMELSTSVVIIETVGDYLTLQEVFI